MTHSFFFRAAKDHAATLKRWQKIKHAASMSLAHGKATISHQHGVGRKAGAQLLYKRLQVQSELQPDAIFIKVDVKAAFQKMERQPGKNKSKNDSIQRMMRSRRIR